MGENKQQILDSLLVAIRLTMAGEDVTELEYIPEDDAVYVYFGTCHRPGRVINVALDSGIAMLKDVINHIDIG